ncbi:hypothetical protein [Pseudoxanthomonas spadix]|uniref:hypothetical protein n=1 Tax=Pseudoxanthomonas spadix TaxID=415229 RepID=UPI000EFF1197|nr:hypothetical protein [Pseudoxanthomonas spadix]MBP3974247.1 hypothetical protein [Pseudoxanthomonas spadix]RMW94697.1 hypothetical protein D9R12_11970 [Pseudoxanthomonas spadix]
MSAAERKGAALELFAKALAANDDGTTHGAAAPPDDVREILENMDRMTPAQRARLARLAEILSEATDRATGQAVGREAGLRMARELAQKIHRARMEIAENSAR